MTVSVLTGQQASTQSDTTSIFFAGHWIGLYIFFTSLCVTSSSLELVWSNGANTYPKIVAAYQLCNCARMGWCEPSQATVDATIIIHTMRVWLRSKKASYRQFFNTHIASITLLVHHDIILYYYENDHTPGEDYDEPYCALGMAKSHV
jgi:hypothetical protein